MTGVEDKGYRVHVVPHSHIDTEWYWTKEFSEGQARRVLRSALEIIQHDPSFRFSQDQVTIWEPAMRSMTPEERERVRSLAKDRKIEVVGGMFVQPEVAEPHGESLVRQILHGRRWFRENLGVEVDCAWNIDTFGQCEQLPQILAKSGYRYLVFARGMPPALREQMPSEFLYVSPDGSGLPTHWMPGHYCGGPENAALLLSILVGHSTSRVLMMPWGCDITVPREDSRSIQTCVRAAAEKAGVELEWVGVSTPAGFFEDLIASEPDLEKFTLDLNPPVEPDLRGTYDNRIELKKLNRATEAAMLAAQNLSCLAWLEGGSYPDEIDSLWEKLIYNHFHDIIGGSHHDTVYRVAMNRLGEVRDRCGEIARSAARALVREGSGQGGIAVFNPLGYARTEICRVPTRELPEGCAVGSEPGRERALTLDDDRFIEFAGEDLPGFGYRTLPLRGGEPDRQVERLSGTTIENPHYRVSMEPDTGSVSSIVDKSLGREILRGPGNELVALPEEDPDLEGGLRLTGLSVHPTDFPPPRTRAYRDSLGSWVESVGEHQDCRRIQRVFLYDGVPRVDFETLILEYRGGNHIFEVGFGLDLEWGRTRVAYETPFSVLERPQGEHYCAQTFVDCSDGGRGAALINSGTPGYWIGDGRIRMVLMRTFSSYSGYVEGRRRLGLDHDDDDSRCVMARENGDHVFRYSLLPHRGGWRESGVVNQAHSFNSPPIAVRTNQSTPSCLGFVQSMTPNFEVVSLKPSGGDLILRGYETLGRAGGVVVRVPFEPRRAWVTNLLEEPVAEARVHGTELACGCAPHEIVTLRVER